MSHDREVLRIVWEGTIPVCFQMDPDEVDILQAPENFYLMISRLSYLPLVTDKVMTKIWNVHLYTFIKLSTFLLQVRKHFSRFISTEQDGEVWFDCNGVPLKWHYPIGMLFFLQIIIVNLIDLL